MPGAGGHVVVLAGGDPVAPSTAALLPGDVYVVAADSGLHQATALGLRADLIVGDLDSVDAGVVDAAVAAGAEVERHPAAKDHTDLELAIRVAQRRGAARVTVVGGHGGRLDHALANVLLLAQAGFSGLTVDALIGDARLAVVHPRAGPFELLGRRADVVSLLPANGDARGVCTTGLLYPLHDDDLPAGTTRGVSNEMTGPVATVSVGAGVLVVVRPGVRGTHVDGEGAASQ